MSKVLYIFPFLGLTPFDHPMKFKLLVLLQISGIWILFVLRSTINMAWFTAQQYLMSLFFSMLVFFLASVTSTIALVETLRTTNKQNQLTKKLSIIDIYLSISHKRYKAKFLKTGMLIFYGTTCLGSSIVSLIVAKVLGDEGLYYYNFLVTSLMELRLFQITLCLDQLVARLIHYKRKLQCLWQFKDRSTVKNLKRMYLVFLDFHNLFHQCFECSLISILACHLLDFILKMYWFLLPLFHLLQYNTMALFFTTFCRVGLQIFVLCRVCQRIRDEVS